MKIWKNVLILAAIPQGNCTPLKIPYALFTPLETHAHLIHMYYILNNNSKPYEVVHYKGFNFEL